MRDALAKTGVTAATVDGYLQVDSLTTDDLGDIAAANGITVHELFTHRSSLEEAFMEMTRDSVEYHATFREPALAGDAR
jgi:ABC-2 type transport system ATP-binding protein